MCVCVCVCVKTGLLLSSNSEAEQCIYSPSLREIHSVKMFPHSISWLLRSSRGKGAGAAVGHVALRETDGRLSVLFV